MDQFQQVIYEVKFCNSYTVMMFNIAIFRNIFIKFI
jgi:hypothetical protein